tara:strand:- start:306 stop:2840 length:2535 start_codon:yes stop_codon:yes gene_type:complete
MRYLYTFWLFVCVVTIGTSQKAYNLSGYVTDNQTGELLIGANIYSTPSKQGTASNTYGYFSVNIPEGKTVFTCSYMGYVTDSITITMLSDSTYNFQLKPQTESLEEVILTSEESNVKSIQNSVINIPIKQVKTLPALFGEGDILKTVQLLPGVQSGNEGTSGFYVRGGGPDQNLILLDGVPVYNSSHLLGFFSIFNEDVIKNINLTKGGFPARFGGRLSSVLEINTKDGNMKKFEVEGGISLISGKITVQGPIKKDKTSFIISARRTWIDLLKKPITNLVEDYVDNINSDGNYYFYDLNAKINHKFSEKDRLYISFYSGKDSFFGAVKTEDTNELTHYHWSDEGHPYMSTFEGNTRFGLSWSNITTAIRWSHVFTNKIFTNTTLLYSTYKFDNTINLHNIWTETFTNPNGLIYGDIPNTVTNDYSDYLYRNGLEDVGLKIDVDYALNTKHYLKMGASYIRHHFFPGYIDWFADVPTENFQRDTTMIFSESIKPNNISLYIEDLYTINNRISANLGLHYNLYEVNNEIYHNLQPRTSIRYLINENSSLKLSYATMQQNIHLLTNSSFGLPNDMWVPSTEIVEPQKSQQSALGYYISFEKGSIGNWLDFKKHNFEASIELYHKKMENLITFSEGTHILGTNFSDWEERVDKSGKGVSKGIEFFIKKKTGRLKGWIGYTISKSTRQFDYINLGREYPYKFDRRHDLSIVASYMIKKGINLNATFVYGSGNAITMPIAKYLVPPFGNNLLSNGTHNFYQYFEYGEKNQFRMNPYHRLDIGCSFTKEKKWGERTWTVSIYNLYSRKNPFFIYLQEDGKEEEGPYQYITHKPMQISLFPIIPSVRYSFKF